MATQQTRSMVSETSICNQALAWLGAPTITSLEDPSTAATLCRTNYPFLRDAVLEERMWTFATVRATSTVGDKDEWGEMYKHGIPTDWLSVFRVYKSVSNNCLVTSREWKREGAFVLSKDPTVYMWGIKRVTDTGQFSSMFVQALAARIAADLAIPITENRALQGDMWQLYGAKLKEASTRDGQQGTNEQIVSNSLIEARNRTL